MASRQRFLPNPFAMEVGTSPPSITLSTEDAKARALLQVSEMEDCVTAGAMMVSTGKYTRDTTVYTGLGGIALTYLRLGQYLRRELDSGKDGKEDDSKRYLQHARRVALDCLEQGYGTEVSFFCGAPGALAVACIASASLGETNSIQPRLEQLLRYGDEAIAHKDDELLFGRAGYMYALLFVRKQLGFTVGLNRKTEGAFDSTLRRVAERIIDSGRSLASRHGYETDGWPLMWHCFREPYVGAAHGVIGILKMLYHTWDLLSPQHQDLVRRTTERILRSVHPRSGNPPIIVGDRRDVHVHWCHGSPGLPAMLAAAIEATGDDSIGTLRAAALRAGEDVWHRGVLLKGNGLCHGVAGNAYAFLTLYKLTGDTVHVDRARAFATLLEDSKVQGAMSRHPDRQRSVMGKPDSPFSLMEGSAGVVCFLLDLARPEVAAFPGWEL